MIDTTDRPCLQYRIRGLHIVELSSKPHDRTWTIFRELDIIALWVGLSEEDRRRALAEALAELVAVTDAGIAAGRELALADAGIAAGGLL